jgi:hypothetical protein
MMTHHHNIYCDYGIAYLHFQLLPPEWMVLLDSFGTYMVWSPLACLDAPSLDQMLADTSKIGAWSVRPSAFLAPKQLVATFSVAPLESSGPTGCVVVPGCPFGCSITGSPGDVGKILPTLVLIMRSLASIISSQPFSQWKDPVTSLMRQW